MVKKNCSNKVIPEYVPENILWYERGSDDYVDQMKFKEYSKKKYKNKYG